MQFPKELTDIRIDHAAVPAHVPKDRVVDLSFAMGGVPNDLVDPYAPCEWLNGQDIPRLLYNPTSGGLGAAVGSASAGAWVPLTEEEKIGMVWFL
jgi:hypothetical protein